MCLRRTFPLCWSLSERPKRRSPGISILLRRRGLLRLPKEQNIFSGHDGRMKMKRLIKSATRAFGLMAGLLALAMMLMNIRGGPVRLTTYRFVAAHIRPQWN